MYIFNCRKAKREMSDNAAKFKFLFMFGAAVLILLYYFVSLHFRKLKYRKIAEGLRAEYQSQGSFKTGEITGSNNGRKYTIATEDTGHGRGSSNWTTISINCANKGIRLQMEGGFFKTFPNWKYAFTTGDRKERVFVTEITLQNWFVPLEEKYKLQVQGLFQEIALLQHDLLKKGHLKIQRDQISFTTQGVLKNAEAASQTISLLTNVADRIESTPIA